MIDADWDIGLEHSLEHYLSKLPQEVPIYWITDARRLNWTVSDIARPVVIAAATTRRLRRCVVTSPNPTETLRLSRLVSNQLRLDRSFWKQLPMEKALFISRDAVLCSTSTLSPSGAATTIATTAASSSFSSQSTLSRFLSANFDYVGAPWASSQPWCKALGGIHMDCCCNTDFSLVDTHRMHTLLNSYAKSLLPRNRRWGMQFTDMFLLFQREAMNMSSRFLANNAADASKAATSAATDATTSATTELALAHLPSLDDAQRFAVETLWDGASAPFGVYKPWRSDALATTMWRPQQQEQHAGVDGERQPRLSADGMYEPKTLLLRLLDVCPEIKSLCHNSHHFTADPDPELGRPAQHFVDLICKDHPMHGRSTVLR
uniref:DUF5672 domain-containing protein n=2 Tax=Chrysotila carterae TaxID=13221 RepID=A0A7S4BS20_CHRCT